MDDNMDKTLKELEQYRIMRQLRQEVAKLVIKYADLRLDPDTISGVLMNAGTKVTIAKSSALIESAKQEAKLEQDQKGFKDEQSN